MNPKRQNSELERSRRVGAIHLLLNHDKDLIRCVFHPGGFYQSVTDLPEEDRLVVLAALDIWEGSGVVTLADLIFKVDHDRFPFFIKAMAYYREEQMDTLRALIDSADCSFPQ